MNALGLIIFLVFVLIKFLGKMPDLKEKLPKDWENKIPKGWEEKWPPILGEMRPETTVPSGTILEEKRRTSRRQKAVKPAAEKEKDYESIPRERPLSREVPQGLMAGDDSKTAKHPLFNSENILNGIIMNEVLQPPRAYRRWNTGGFRQP